MPRCVALSPVPIKPCEKAFARRGAAINAAPGVSPFLLSVCSFCLVFLCDRRCTAGKALLEREAKHFELCFDLSTPNNYVFVAERRPFHECPMARGRRLK